MNQDPPKPNARGFLWASVRHGPVARLAATNFAVQGTAFAAGVVAARVLGVEGRGDLAAVLLWPMLAANIGSLGVDWALAVQAGRRPDLEGQLTRFGVLHGLVAGPVFMLLAWMLVRHALPAGRDDLVRLAGVVLWLIPFHLVWLDCLGIDNGLQRYMRYNLTRLSFYLVYTVGYVVCWSLGAGQLRYFVYVYLGAMIVVALVRVFHSPARMLRDRTQHIHVSDTLRLARAFALSTAVTMLQARIDVILVMLLLGARDLGLYVVAQSLANVPSLLSRAFAVRTFGSSAGQDDESAFASIVVSRFRQSLLLSGILAVLLAGAAPWVIVVLFGPDFAEAASVARVLFVASWLLNAGRIIDEGFRGRGRPIFGTVAFSVFIVCVCAAGPVLARQPGMGRMGIAWAVLAASVLLVTVLILIFKRQTGLWVVGRLPLSERS